MFEGWVHGIADPQGWDSLSQYWRDAKRKQRGLVWTVGGLEVTKKSERLVFQRDNVLVRRQTPKRVGSLARWVIHSLQGDTDHWAKAERLLKACVTWHVALPWDSTELQRWARQLEVSSQLLLDASEHEATPSVVKQWLSIDSPNITWVPSRRASRLFRIESPVDAVTISASEGWFSGNLRVCVSCGLLLEAGWGKGRLKRCVVCNRDRNIRLSRPAVQQTYSKVLDRIRHRPDSREDKQQMTQALEGVVNRLS